jgi:hypothetical protein
MLAFDKEKYILVTIELLIRDLNIVYGILARSRKVRC